jgi:hypothetical protein
VNILRRKFPEVENWLNWWLSSRHARLIFMSQKTTEAIQIHDILPSTNNLQEAFHRVFQMILPRKNLPIFMVVEQAFYLVTQLEFLHQTVLTGQISPGRRRGKLGRQTGLQLAERGSNPPEFKSKPKRNDISKRKTPLTGSTNKRKGSTLSGEKTTKKR